MHLLPSLFVFIFSLQFQIVWNTTTAHTLPLFVFIYFSAVPNRFNSRYNACFRNIAFICFSAVPNRFDNLRMHALETLFSFFLCSSKWFQISSECMRKRHCFQNDLCSSDRFKYCHSTWFNDIVIQMFSAFPNHFKYLQNAYFRDIAPGSYTSDLIINFGTCVLL